MAKIDKLSGTVSAKLLSGDAIDSTATAATASSAINPPLTTAPLALKLSVVSTEVFKRSCLSVK